MQPSSLLKSGHIVHDERHRRLVVLLPSQRLFTGRGRAIYIERIELVALMPRCIVEIEVSGI